MLSELAVELFLVIITAAFIGWLLGRFLCKSREHDERTQKNQREMQIATLTAEMEERNTDIEALRLQLNDQGKVNAELEQHKESQATQINTMQEERKKLLKKQNELEVSHARLISLTEKYEQQQDQMQEMGKSKTLQAAKIEQLQKNLQRSIGQFKKSEQQRQQQQQDIDLLQSDNKRQADFIKELTQDREALAQLRLDHDEAKSRIKMLEEDKHGINERFNELRKEHQQLRQQCSSLREDSLQFSDRFSDLIREKQELGQEVERLNIEKNDYLGRLRAISSVVDVVGTEQYDEET